MEASTRAPQYCGMNSRPGTLLKRTYVTTASKSFLRGFRSAVAAACAATATAQITVIQSSAAGDKWTPLPSLSWGADFPSATYVQVNHSIPAQTMMGFGAAFTDTSAYNAMVWMQPAIRQEFLQAYWGDNGLQFTIGRVTINSADYSFQSFNYDNVTDDFNLSAFDHNITYDGQRVIPLIKAAMATSSRPIKLFGSPWSPPGWMKTNGNMINSLVPCLKNDTAAGDSYKQTWANYIKAWLDAYAAKGLPMWGLTPQNEPMACQAKFESCGYSGADMADFIGTYLGPTVKPAYPDLNIMLYDHNKLAADSFSAPSLTNATVAQYLSGVALHWYDYESSLGLDHVAAVNALAPSLFMLNTEACYLQSLIYPWSIGELYAADIIGDINFGVAGWLAWNHVLLIGDKYPWAYGGPNHDNTRMHLTWQACVVQTFGDPILFQYNATGSQALVYQSSYYIIGHISRYAAPGSTRVATWGAGVALTAADYDAIRAHALGQSNNGSLPLMATAFVSEDETSVSVVVCNPSDFDVTFKLADTGASGPVPRAVKTTIPAHAIQTYTYPV